MPSNVNAATVNVATEYGTLRRVPIRYADDTLPDFDRPNLHPVLARQMTTSSWSTYSRAKVLAQQRALVDLLTDHCTEVVLLPGVPGCAAQHYPRDIGFVIDDVLFAARLNSPHRLPETDVLTRLTPGSSGPVQLAAGPIEGGDVMLHDGVVLVGLGEETSLDGAHALQDALSRHGIDRDVIPVRFAVPGIVHLDDHFAVVAAGTALIHRDVFPADQIRWLTERFDLIDVTDDEARTVQVNVLAIAPGVVVVAAGSDRIAARLMARGIDVLTVDYCEVTRVPGSLRCTTLPLLRT